MPDNQILTKHGEEIAALREGHKTLEQSMAQLTENVRSMGSNLSTQIEGNREATHRELGIIKDEISHIGKPNYGTIFTGVALVVTMGIAIMTPIWQGINTIKQEDKELRQDFQSHTVLPVHPVAKQILEDNFLLQNERHKDTHSRIELLEANITRQLQAQKEYLQLEIDKKILEKRPQESDKPTRR